jgi:hypothetical protein
MKVVQYSTTWHAGVARRYGSWEGGRAFKPPWPRESSIFPLTSAVLHPTGLHHVVLASHINWIKIKMDHLNNILTEFYQLSWSRSSWNITLESIIPAWSSVRRYRLYRGHGERTSRDAEDQECPRVSPREQIHPRSRSSNNERRQEIKGKLCSNAMALVCCAVGISAFIRRLRRYCRLTDFSRTWFLLSFLDKKEKKKKKKK